VKCTKSAVCDGNRLLIRPIVVLLHLEIGVFSLHCPLLRPIGVVVLKNPSRHSLGAGCHGHVVGVIFVDSILNFLVVVLLFVPTTSITASFGDNFGHPQLEHLVILDLRHVKLALQNEGIPLLVQYNIAVCAPVIEHNFLDTGLRIPPCLVDVLDHKCAICVNPRLLGFLVNVLEVELQKDTFGRNVP